MLGDLMKYVGCDHMKYVVSDLMQWTVLHFLWRKLRRTKNYWHVSQSHSRPCTLHCNTNTCTICWNYIYFPIHTIKTPTCFDLF